MKKPFKLNTRQYVGLVHDLNSSMAHMPPLFDKNQQIVESELVNSLAKKLPRSDKAMLILQGFNPETGYLATVSEHCKQAITMDNISVTKFSIAYEGNDTKRQKKHSNFKKREENIKKHRKKYSRYSSIYGENKGDTSRECNILKKRAKHKDNPKYGKKDNKKKFK